MYDRSNHIIYDSILSGKSINDCNGLKKYQIHKILEFTVVILRGQPIDLWSLLGHQPTFNGSVWVK